MNLKKWLSAMVIMILCGPVFSQQLSLGNNPYFLRKSAVLELNSNNQGLLMPRISDTNLINALLPPDGMMIYHSTVKQIMVRSNGYWSVMPTSTNIPMNWYVTGNSGTIPSQHFLGTLDDKPMIIKSNNQIFWEFGRRATLGLTQNYPDYTDDNERVTHLRSSLQFEAAAAQFYKPKMFVDANGNFRMKGSAAGTDYFEFGSTGAANSNNGGFEFVIGDDGDEPIVFKSYDFDTPPYFTEIMRLQSGKMGLGTATPTEKLDVLGNIRFSGALMPNNLPGTSGYLLRSNGAGSAPTWLDPATLIASSWIYNGNNVSALQNFGTISNYALPIITNNVERMRILANGNVGIGNTTASEKLDVTGNIKFSGALMPNNLPGTSGFILRSNGAGVAPTWLDPATLTASSWIYNGNNVSTLQNFGTISNFALPIITNNVERMRILANGNVGIGNTTASEKLDVTGNIKFSGALMPNNLPGTSGFILRSNGAGVAPTWVDPANLATAGWTLSGNAVTAIQKLGTTTNIPLPFYTNNTEWMRLSVDGKLGIGTTSPTEALDVSGNLRISGGNRRLIFGNVGGDPDALIELRNYGGGEKSELLFYSGNDPQTSFGPDRIRMVAEEFRVQSFGTDQGSILNAENENGVNTRFYIDPNGNVAIGATPISGYNPEKLLIDAGTTTSINLVKAQGSIDNYLQFNIQNNSNGSVASSDVVATANNGNESVNYIDMGINSSGFTNTSYPIIGGQNTAYLYATGNDMVIGNASSGRNLRLFTGGFASANERVRIEGDGDVGINTTTPTAKLDVSGTFKLGSSGTILSNIIKGTISVPDPGSFNYNETKVVTVNIAGITVGNTIILNPRTNLPNGIGIGWSRVSSNGILSIGYTNTGSATTVGIVAFDITIIQ